MQFSVEKRCFHFKPLMGGTSRGVLKEKDSWFISVWNEESPEVVGVGECSIIPRLSIDNVPELEKILESPPASQRGENGAKANTNSSFFILHSSLKNFPALQFALETALLDLHGGGRRILFPSAFTEGKASIPINGLIWMGDFDTMWAQAEQKAREGFAVLKMKVGALHFDEELYFVSQLRRAFPHLELRLDANGNFPAEEALERLQALAQYRIHSIEQPIQPKNTGKMAQLCKTSPIPIALDEELIGVHDLSEKEKLLQEIQPQYIILKPSLLGGFRASDEWIALAERQGIGWWATSALESNIGLNAIAQWAFTKGNPLPQGLGTGGVFTDNIEMPLSVVSGQLLVVSC